ncbi:MAG: group III truncated hemoglobin [Arenicella sp.]|nr:group III truncated hemoglobin [Arenicella sp.]
MNKSDVLDRVDVQDIVSRFYAEVLEDVVIGFIFTDVARINLETHLPVIVDFWSDILFEENNYQSNALQKHLQLNDRIALKPGHFTRWLYLFARAVDHKHAGDNAELMKQRAEMVASSISAAISSRKKNDMDLVLKRP